MVAVRVGCQLDGGPPPTDSTVHAQEQKERHYQGRKGKIKVAAGSGTLRISVREGRPT